MQILLTNSRRYWQGHKQLFPHHIIRPPSDPKPSEIAKEFIFFSYFIVAIFDGKAHWGFQQADDAALFAGRYPSTESSNA